MASSFLSDSDPDDALDADMEALRKACILAGTDPADLGTASSVYDPDLDSDSGSGSMESSGGEDLGLLRRLKERFTLPSPTMDSSPLVTPSCSNMSSGEIDDEDDFETLRAIQRRFTKYESDSLSRSSEKIIAEPAVFGNGDISGPKTPNRCAELSKEHGQKLLDHEAYNLNVRDLVSSKFPKSAQNFVDALKKNRSCQKFIRRKLLELEAKIEKNKELKERVKCLMDFQVACKRKVSCTVCRKNDPRVKLISVKKPMPERSSKTNLRKGRASYLGPDENYHVSNYRMVLERFAISLSKQPWSNAENDNLTRGIMQQYQEMLILNLKNMRSETEGTMDSNLSSPLLHDYEFTHESIRSFIPSVNWNRLACMYLKGRSGAECEARWLNCEDPMINHDRWTPKEDKKLLFIAQERGICNWIDISISLGTHRTPFQCLARYQRSLNPHILNKEWTEAEDVKLRAAVENYGKKNWQMVASYVESRTGTQCSNRWWKILNPERQRVGRWSIDEDKRLKITIMLFGTRNWGKIAHFIPGRTQVQCRERWLNCLDPTLNLKPWTAEEEAKLLDAYAIHGNCWSKIAACIPPRTDNQCRRRWKILCPEEALMLNAAAKIKKTALIGNFVDRESERPALGPNDFTSLTVHESVGGAKVRKKKLSNNLPKKSRSKPRRVTKNSKKVPVINKSTDLVPSDLSLPPNIECNSTGGLDISRSRNNIPRKSRVKSRRLLENNLTADGMVNTSSDAAAVTMPPETAVSLNAMESTIIQKTMDNHNRLRKRQCVKSISQGTLTGGSGRDNLLVSGEDSSVGLTPRENPRTYEMQSEETSRAMVGDGAVAPNDDDSSLLFTFYKGAKRKRRHIVTEKNEQAAADPSKIKARNVDGAAAADDDSPPLALLHEKRKRKCAVTEEDTEAAVVSAEKRAMHGGDEADDSSLLSTFYERAKKRSRKCAVTEEDTEAAVVSAEKRAMHGGDEADDSSLLSTFYKRAKKRSRKCLVTEENRQAAKD